jgi:ankyrin repeat protein
VKGHPDWSIGINLNSAIEFDRLDWLRGLLGLGVPVDVRSTDFAVPTRGATGLMVAAFWKRLASARTLLEAGADANAVDQRYWTPLMHAIEPTEGISMVGYSGRPDDALAVVNHLINAGANVNQRTRRGWSALMLAILADRPQITERLTQAGALPEGREQAHFFRACGRGDIEAIERAVRAGADVNALGEPFGETALNRACYWQAQTEVVEALLKAGADVNRKSLGGRTPLMTAAGIEDHNWSEAHPRLVERLIEAGARLEEEDDEGMTALCLAEAEGHEQAADLLRGAGALERSRAFSKREVDIGSVRSAIQHADTGAPTYSSGSSMKWLMEWLACNPPRPLLNEGLLYAAAHGNPAVVGRFLEAGADADYWSALGETALKNAAACGRGLAIDILIGLPTFPGDAAVAARWARAEGHVEIAEKLEGLQ